MSELIEIPVIAKNGRPLFEVIKDYGNSLFNFIRGKVKTAEDAEDILQEVWFQLSKMEEPVGHLGGWLYSVAQNKIIDKYRKHKTESLDDFAYEDEEGSIDFRDILLIDDAGNPETQYLKKLFWDEMNIALAELPENQRTVFIQNEFDGKTFREISEETGENIKTLISRKRYAVAYLQTRLENTYKEFFD